MRWSPRASTGISRVASVAASAERGETRRSDAQQLVGIDGAAHEHGGQHHHQQAQREQQAIDERLDRQVHLAERPEVAQAREHGEAAAADQDVDERP